MKPLQHNFLSHNIEYIERLFVSQHKFVQNQSMEKHSPINFFEYFTDHISAPHVIKLILQHFTFVELADLATVSSSYYDNLIRCVDLSSRETSRSINTASCSCKSSDPDPSSFAKATLIKDDDASRFVNLRQTVDLASFSKVSRLKIAGSIKFKDIKSLRLDNLKELSVSQSWDIDSVSRIVNCSPSLEILELDRINGISRLLDKLKDHIAPNTLKCLHLTDFSSYNFEPDKKELLELLESQKDSLEILRLDIWIGFPALKLMLTMPNLCTVELYELAKSHRTAKWIEQVLPISDSITKLTLQDITNDSHLMESMMRSCPKVTSLKVYDKACISKSLMARIASRMEIKDEMLGSVRSNPVFKEILARVAARQD